MSNIIIIILLIKRDETAFKEQFNNINNEFLLHKIVSNISQSNTMKPFHKINDNNKNDDKLLVVDILEFLVSRSIVKQLKQYPFLIDLLISSSHNESKAYLINNSNKNNAIKNEQRDKFITDNNNKTMQKIANTQSKEYAALFMKFILIIKYILYIYRLFMLFDGKHSVEDISYIKNISKRDLKMLFEKYSQYIEILTL